MRATAERAVQATDVILRDGSTLRLRAPAAEDADALLEFFANLSEHSRYLRFHGFPALGPKLVEPLVEPDWEERGALLGSLDGRPPTAVARSVALAGFEASVQPPSRLQLALRRPDARP